MPLLFSGFAAVNGITLAVMLRLYGRCAGDYALGYKLWFYDFFVNMRKWVWKCAK